MPHPNSGESESDFIERAHRELASEFPDTDQRNAVVFKLWREHHGQSETEKRSYAKFNDSEFVRVRNVGIWKEHEYRHFDRDGQGNVKTDGDGEPIEVIEKYDLSALKKIIDRCNYRIEDTGDFVPLSAGHTLDGKTVDPRLQPEVVGFAGPFRLGQVGNKNPKWAIFADEVHYRDKAKDVERMPRRSPEILLHKNMDDRYFDPISVLGAVTPRSDLGLAGSVRYCKDKAGHDIVRYSAPAVKYMAPAMAGPMSVTTPGDDGGKKEKANAGPDAPETRIANVNEMDDDTIRKFMEAFRALPELEWVRGAMQKEATPEPITDREKLGEGMEDEEPGDGEDGEDGEKKPDGEKPEEKPFEKEEPMSNEEKDKYAKDVDILREENRTLKVQYAEQGEKLKALEASVGTITVDRTNATRLAKLTELKRVYRMDFKAEVQRCAADKMSDDAFSAHQDIIINNYEKLPINVVLHTPDLADEGVMEKQKNARETHDKAMALHQSYSRAGKYVPYDDCLKEARAG